MHDGVGSLERLSARVGVTDVPPDQLHAPARQSGGDVLLAVQEHVQHAHLVARAQKLVDDEAADIARAARDADLHGSDRASCFSSLRNMCRSSWNSMSAFSQSSWRPMSSQYPS